MKLTFYTSLLSLFLAAASCERLPDEGDDVSGNDVVRLEASIAQLETRASIRPDGTGVFENGDLITLCTTPSESNIPELRTVAFDGETWTPAPVWSELGAAADFAAWYPAPTPESGTFYTHRVASDQSTSAAYEASDLLGAQIAAQRGETVRLAFRHLMCHLVIRLTGDGYSDEELREALVEIRTHTQIGFDLRQAEVSQAEGLDHAEWIVPRTLEDGSRTAVLCPQEMSQFRTGGWIRISLGSKQVSFDAPEMLGSAAFERLLSGHEVTVNLTVHKGQAPDPQQRVVWAQGVQAPSDGQWSSDRTRLPWWEGCGWYDCNKVNPAGNPSVQINDSQLCWAAATSNMIHWWLDRNREWIETQGYDVPSKLTDMLHSEVFDLYKQCFANAGNIPLHAINWYFNGVFRKNIYETDPVDERAGFFRDAFGIHSLGRQYDVLTKETFTSLVLEAFRNGRAVSYAFSDPRWQAHAVTLWGVELDDEGYVKYLYMVDNNDGANDARGTVRRQEVRYKQLTPSDATLMPYVPNSLGDFKYRIYALYTLDRGLEWQRQE